MKSAPKTFSPVEFDNFKPLVLLHESGRGMFSKRASKELFVSGVCDGDRVRLFFDPKTNLPGGTEFTKGYVVKVELFKNVFYFRSKAIINQLKTRFPRTFYCSEINIYPRVYFYRGIHILMWELYNTHDLTLNMEYKATHAEKQKKRAEQIKCELISLLEIDQETYNVWVFETAFKYLEKLFGGDLWSVEKLTEYEPFWQWWKNQYNIENESLLHILKSSTRNDIVFYREAFQMQHINIKRYLEGSLYHYLHQEKEKVIAKIKKQKHLKT